MDTKNYIEGEVKTSFKITDIQANNIMFSFLVIGMNSEVVNWVEKVELITKPNKTEIWQELPDHGILLIHDRETGEAYSFTILNLKQGIEKLLEEGLGYLNDGYFRLGFRADLANRIVQYGIFGEVRYE